MSKNNVEFLTEVMEYSKHGALMQAFVLDALDHRCNHLLKDEEQTLQALKGSMVSGQAWLGCARELKDKLDKRYEIPKGL